MRTCRTCGWPLIGTYDRCPWCGALVVRTRDTMPLEPALIDDDREDFESWQRDNHPAMPDVDGRREAYYHAGQYPPKPII